jgi:microcystin-dependent protein
MSEPFLSEIRIVAFDFAPQGWALCNGQILPINQNQALFSLIGTIYGGNGTTNFALPNLQGCVPMHVGGSFSLGNAGGEASHTLTQNEMPAHRHAYTATSDAATTAGPAGARPAAAPALIGNVYAPGPANTPLSAASIGPPPANGQPHSNLQPYLALNFVIALQGIFPSRN